ncbi:SdrD B-like domain-containing protein [Roseiconus nitratireducens]|nr:SdrD B-like domain-containing protein [Roseiconus nitratireducens]
MKSRFDNRPAQAGRPGKRLSRPKRRRGTAFQPRLETLENRRVLAVAVDLASISGTLFDDVNGNDQVDVGEPRISGAQVRLENVSGGVVDTATTNSDGLYSFPRVTAGNYVVRQLSQTTSGGRQLEEKLSPTITVTTEDVAGRLVEPIDTFNDSFQKVTDTTNDGVPVTDQLLTEDAIGGQRDLIVSLSSPQGTVQLAVDDPTLVPNAITFDSLGGGDGERRIVWDGIDSDPVDVDDTGLNEDLTGGGQAVGFNLVMGTDTDEAEAILRVYSNDDNSSAAGRYSEAIITIPHFPAGTVDRQVEFVPFSVFSAIGGGADFTNVTAVELEITGGLTTNGIAELIGAFGQTPFVANFDNFDEADLAVTKSVDNLLPDVGQTVTYTIGITNNGPAAATGVQVTDLLPSGVRFLSSSAGDNYNASTGIWNVGSLPVGAGSQATLSIVGRVESLGTKTNTATVTRSDQTDAVTSNNVASVDLTPRQIDLNVTKTVDDLSPNLGDTITFTITVGNSGPQQATGVQVRDLLPSGIRINSPSDVTTTAGTYNAATGLWDVGSINANASQTLTIRAVVDSAGPRNNSAEVIAANETDFDSTPGDGMGDDFATVAFATASANLALSKTVNDTTPNLNDDVDFVITVTNSGPDAATGVTVRDLLPPGMTFLSSSVGQDYNAATGIWTLGSVAAGGSASLTINARVDTIGAKTNVAQIQTSNVDDPNSTPGNNAPAEDDQADVTITPTAADLSLTKSVNSLAPDVGDTITFQITVANSGPDAATGVQVRDQLPAGTQFVSAALSSGGGSPEYAPNTGIWNVGNVAVGSPVTLNLTALVTDAGLATNFAQIIASDQADPDSTPGNNDPNEDDQDEASIRPREIDLSLTKVVNNFSPSVGDEIEFVITVNNAGPDVATGVLVEETLPEGVTPLSETPSRGSYNRSTGVWNIGTVGLNDPVTLTIRTRVDSIGMGTNRAEVIAADQRDTDSTPDNNVPTEDDQASVGFTTESADLSLQKLVVGDPRPNAGDQVSFDLIVTNSGPDNATGVQITDLLPTGLTYVSNTVSAGIYNPASGVWTVGELPAPTERQTLVIGPGIYDATSGNVSFVQANSPATYQSPIAAFQSDPLGQTADALVALGFVPSQFQLRQVSRNDNPNGLNIEIRFLGEALAGVDIPRIDLVPNLNAAVNTQTIEDDAVNTNSSATLRINAIVDTTEDITNIAEVTAAGQTDPDSTPGDGEADQDDRATATLMPQSIDLSLTKTANTDKPNPGDEVVFTLQVTNDGPDPATGVEVTDLLPDGLTFVRSEPSGVYDPNTGIWSVGQLGIDASKSLNLIAIANSNVAETNNAEITAADQRDVDSTPGNGDPDEDDIAGATVTPATADLSVEKTADDMTPNVGDDVVFTIRVRNDGPDDATNVALRDQIPTGMTLAESTVTDGDYDASNGVWTIPSLPAGQDATLTLQASVDSVEDKTNVAQIIASDQFDPDSTPANDDPTEDDQASASLSPELVDLALTKEVDQDMPNIGDVVLFEIALSNDGPSDATGVTVLDQLPEGLTFQSSQPSSGSYDPLSGIWNVGTVPAGETPTLQIEAVVETISSAVNTAQVQTIDQPDSDSVPGNDDPEEDDQASVTLMTQVADLSIEKTASTETPGRTEEFEFTIRVSNAGPNTATGVIVNDPLPPGLRFISADPSTGTYDPETGQWMIPSIPMGSPQTLRIVTAVTSAEPSTNVAEIIQTRQIDPDSTPGNGAMDEDDIASITVTPRVVDVSVTGSVSDDAPLEGDTIQLSFTASNEGPSDATGVEFSVLLPDGLTLVSSQPQSGTYNSNTGRWIVGDVPAGSATRLVLNVRIDQRGIKNVPIELVAANEFDVDSTPDNGIEQEDDQTSVIIRAPRLLNKRLFLSR